jgi:hypothetical protein
LPASGDQCRVNIRIRVRDWPGTAFHLTGTGDRPRSVIGPRRSQPVLFEVAPVEEGTQRNRARLSLRARQPETVLRPGASRSSRCRRTSRRSAGSDLTTGARQVLCVLLLHHRAEDRSARTKLRPRRRPRPEEAGVRRQRRAESESQIRPRVHKGRTKGVRREVIPRSVDSATPAANSFHATRRNHPETHGDEPNVPVSRRARRRGPRQRPKRRKPCPQTRHRQSTPSDQVRTRSHETCCVR